LPAFELISAKCRGSGQKGGGAATPLPGSPHEGPRRFWQWDRRHWSPVWQQYTWWRQQ